MTFGDLLHSKMKEKMITQEALGKTLGLSQDLMSLWVRNIKFPSWEQCIDIGCALNVDITLLYELTGESNSLHKAVLQDVEMRRRTGRYKSLVK